MPLVGSGGRRRRRCVANGGLALHVPWDAGTRVELERSADWADQRARALALPRAEVVGVCRRRWRMVRCGCGYAEVPVGCDFTGLCDWCRKRHWRRWRRRIVRAMGSHLQAARAAWNTGGRRGKLPGVYLLTLTVPHSGSIIEDREKLGAAWRKLTKRAHAGKWWSTYALTYEVTPGRDGLGHVHAHIAAISSWIPYEDLHKAWREVAPGARVLDVSAPRAGKAASVADYLAKYCTKGVDPAVFTGQKAGELLVAQRGKRRVTTSLGFWRPLKDRSTACKRCGREHEIVRLPGGLRTVAPGAALQAMAERIGFYVPRGALQVVMGFG